MYVPFNTTPNDPIMLNKNVQDIAPFPIWVSTVTSGQEIFMAACTAGNLVNGQLCSSIVALNKPSLVLAFEKGRSDARRVWRASGMPVFAGMRFEV